MLKKFFFLGLLNYNWVAKDEFMNGLSTRSHKRERQRHSCGDLLQVALQGWKVLNSASDCFRHSHLDMHIVICSLGWIFLLLFSAVRGGRSDSTASFSSFPRSSLCSVKRLSSYISSVVVRRLKCLDVGETS